jgi:hypothetical protein
MNFNLSKKNKFGFVLYVLGIVILMSILTITAWSDVEALKLDVSIIQRGTLSSLRCPIFITPKETSTISLKVNNPRDLVHKPIVTTLITRSTLSLLNKEVTFLELQPGETQILTREINSKDSVFDRLVLVKAIVDNPYPTKDVHNVCGVMVVNIDFLSGSQLSAILMTLGVLLILIGLILYTAGKKPFGKKFGMHLNIKLFLAILIFLSIIISNYGYFIIGLVGFFIATITIIVLLFGDREFAIQD